MRRAILEALRLKYEAEIAEAEALIKVYDAALARGEGAVAYQGKMIDIPIADRARALLVQRDRIASRQSKKQLAMKHLVTICKEQVDKHCDKLEAEYGFS